MKVINIFLILLALGILVYSRYIFSSQSFHVMDRGDDDQLIGSSVLAAGILLWPVIWDAVVGYDKLFSCSPLYIAFAWPIVLLLFQMYDSHCDYQEDIENVQNQRHDIIKAVQSDSGTIISVAFAMGTIFLVMSRLGNEKILYESVRIVIVALIMCIAFIMPTANFMDNSHRYTVYIRYSQRVFINYVVGLVVAALIMMFYTSKDHKNLFKAKGLPQTQEEE